MDKHTHIALPTALVNQLANYLSRKPYLEVKDYLTAFETLGKAVTLQDAEEAPKEDNGESQAS